MDVLLNVSTREEEGMETKNRPLTRWERAVQIGSARRSGQVGRTLGVGPRVRVVVRVQRAIMTEKLGA